MHRHNWFVTLTYDDKHLPADGSLRYRHFQLFMYRLRQSFGRVRFFMSGEYGTKTDRPHYHAIFFGLNLSDLERYKRSDAGNTLFTSASLSKEWGKGYCVIGSVTPESAAYVASYVNKKITGDRAAAHYASFDRNTGEVTQRVPEFAHMSLRPGIGATWLAKYKGDCFPRDHVLLNERKYALPAYYSRKLKASDPFTFDEILHDRIMASDRTIAERSPARLAAREAVFKAKLNLNRRSL